MCPTSTVAKEQRLRATKAFQRLWVAGTLGAFFTALARSLPVDLRHLVYSFDAGFALNAALRYGYLLWLIWYFFLSNLRSQSDDPPRDHEVAYDVVQSVFGLSAAFYLDFLVANEHHGIRAYIAPNIAIFVICFLALIWFSKEARYLQIARGIGAAVAAASAICVWFIPNDPWWAVAALVVPLAVLLLPIYKFHQLRVAENRQQAEAPGPSAWVEGKKVATQVIPPASDLPATPAEDNSAKTTAVEKKSD